MFIHLRSVFYFFFLESDFVSYRHHKLKSQILASSLFIKNANLLSVYYKNACESFLALRIMLIWPWLKIFVKVKHDVHEKTQLW